MADTFYELLNDVTNEFVLTARGAFDDRMKAREQDIFDKEVNDVVGGLMARQLSLATNIAQSPLIWNMHTLPILLRCMADVYITFCWVLKDRAKRSRMFIEYGLGQEKLAIEKYRDCLAAEANPDPQAHELLTYREELLNAEQASFLVPVNLGSWSEMNLRNMAIEVGEKQFYDLVFTQFSAAVHSTWQHIWRINLSQCENPLHMGHRVPIDRPLPPDPQTFTNAAKYLGKTFHKFDIEVLGVDDAPSAYRCFNQLWDRFANYFNSQTEE